MPFSTGRGGAGNFHSAKDSTKSELTAVSDAKHSPPPHDNKHDHFVSTGRGGAGNITRSEDIPLPKLVPQGSNTPQLHTSKITTGRGGYGNMVNNDDPELTRRLQDVDRQTSPKENELQAQVSNRSFTVGRGGFGNVISQTRSHSSLRSGGLGEPANLMAVTSRGRRPDHRKGFMTKIKEIFL